MRLIRLQWQGSTYDLLHRGYNDSKLPTQDLNALWYKLCMISVTYQRSSGVRGLSTSRNNLEKHPNWRADHCNAASGLPGKASKKAHTYYRIKCHIDMHKVHLLAAGDILQQVKTFPLTPAEPKPSLIGHQTYRQTKHLRHLPGLFFWWTALDNSNFCQTGP